MNLAPMENNSQKLSDLTIEGAIRLLRELALLGVISYLFIKLFSGELSLDFAKLSATELVNLLLAFFSIALSAAFYFAATSQSNQFYDNVNKFSKETSELLGRVDEQIKGIGGRQTELRDSFDKYYSRGRGQADATQEVEAQAKAVEENLSKIVGEILDKTSLPVPERERIQAELKAKDAELSELRERLSRDSAIREGQVTRYAQSKIKEFGAKKAAQLSFEEWAVPVLQLGVPAYRRDLFNLGYVTRANLDSVNEITSKGRQMLLTALDAVVEQDKT